MRRVEPAGTPDGARAGDEIRSHARLPVAPCAKWLLVTVLAGVGWYAPGGACGDALWGAGGRRHTLACSPACGARQGASNNQSDSSARWTTQSTLAERLCGAQAPARLKGGGGRGGTKSACCSQSHHTCEHRGMCRHTDQLSFAFC
jgi:hypothetical protein